MKTILTTILFIFFLIYSNAQCISGDCENGYGTYVDDDIPEYKYVGKWKNGKKNGKGIKTFTDGIKYVGEFKNDNYHGDGTETFIFNGNVVSKYVGEWKNGYKKKGIYTSITADGYLEYIGEFKNLDYHGIGIETFFVDNVAILKYEGEFKNGKKNGKGILSWPKRGEIYIGEFKNDNYHGEGTWYDSKGNKYFRNFNNGVSVELTYKQYQLMKSKKY